MSCLHTVDKLQSEVEFNHVQDLNPNTPASNPLTLITWSSDGNCPGFRSLRQICGSFSAGSAKIVALNLEDIYRSAGSLQKCADFL